jgi:hypothetical protein
MGPGFGLWRCGPAGRDVGGSAVCACGESFKSFKHRVTYLLVITDLFPLLLIMLENLKQQTRHPTL